MGIATTSKALKAQRKAQGYYKGYYVRKFNNVERCYIVTSSGEVIEESFITEAKARSYIDRMRTKALTVIKSVEAAEAFLARQAA